MAIRSRATLGLDRKEFAVLLAYVAVVCLAVTHYQPWEDEGRAWMDAKDSGLFTLVFHILRFEGHPPIWYLVLWPLAHLHVPFLVINWVSAACGAAGIYVLLRYSPFPFYLKALLPFGFALGFEYSVVGRGYCLYPLLGFFVAHQYRQKTRNPVMVAVALGLLANLSLHGTIVAAGFAVAYSWNLMKESRRAAPTRELDRQAWWGAGIFAASLVFVAIVVWPAKGLVPPVGPQITRLYHKLEPASYQPTERRRAALRTVAFSSHDGTISAAPPRTIVMSADGSNAGLSIKDRLYLALVYPISTLAPLALLFQALVLVYLFRRGQGLLLLPLLLLPAFLVVVYLKMWHTGLVWVTFVMVLWAVWDESEPPVAFTLQHCVAGLLGLLSLLQLPWLIGAVRYDLTHSTYPARATANYIKSLPVGTRIDGFDHSFTVLPYFDRYPFHKELEGLSSISAALGDKPDVIILREASIPPSAMDELLAAGYRQTHAFCGAPYFPNQPFTPMCLLVLDSRQ